MASSTRGPPGTVAKTNPPNQTLYVRNLPDQLRKEDLKRNLYMLFVTYGVVLDIVAIRNPKMRGQAHVVFRDVDTSTQAMRALDGFEFFGKKMQIQYAKGKSLTVSKLDGSFQIPEKVQPESATDPSSSEVVGFGNAPVTRAKPINAPSEDSTKGVKRGREEESEDEDEDEEAAMDVSDSE